MPISTMLVAGSHDLANSLLKIPVGFGQVNVEAKVETARACSAGLSALHQNGK